MVKVSVLVMCCLVAGCSVATFFTPEGPLSNKEIYSLYRQTILKQSTSADVLSAFGTPKYALLSQSKSIVALCGDKKEGNDILDAPYANENARRIAILKNVEADTRKDTGEVGADNAMLTVCGMMTGQAMGSLLTKLDISPAMASRFGEPNGLEFEHTSFDKGRLRMVIDNDIVTVRMQLGSFMKRGKLGFGGVWFDG